MKLPAILFGCLLFRSGFCDIADEMIKKPTHKLVRDSLNHMFGKEDALLYRCDLQCYCDKCSETVPAFKQKCKEMLPKRRIPNCKCDDREVDCSAAENLDESCMVYCFCKNCRDDPRMIPQLKAHCDESNKWVQTCECEKFSDCDVLDVMQTSNSKKGKLKSKSYDKEL